MSNTPIFSKDRMESRRSMKLTDFKFTLALQKLDQ